MITVSSYWKRLFYAQYKGEYSAGIVELLIVFCKLNQMSTVTTDRVINNNNNKKDTELMLLTGDTRTWGLFVR